MAYRGTSTERRPQILWKKTLRKTTGNRVFCLLNFKIRTIATPMKLRPNYKSNFVRTSFYSLSRDSFEFPLRLEIKKGYVEIIGIYIDINQTLQFYIKKLLQNVN